MLFVLGKYAQATFKRGKFFHATNVNISDNIIRNLEEEKVDKYLEVSEVKGMQLS